MRATATLAADRIPLQHGDAAGRTRCVVLGAGIAGLVAGLELARSGFDVAIVESSPFAGGRTSSWLTPSGLHADTGFHVLADHYETLFDVLRSVGAGDDVLWWDEHRYRRLDGSDMLFRLSPLPAPLHLLYPARAMSLSAAARWRVVCAASEVAFASQSDLRKWDDVSYLDWHRRHRLDDGFLLELAEYAADATTFLPPDQVSARTLLSWLKYMFRGAQSARIGAWRKPMSASLVAPLVRAFERHGGVLRTATAVVRLERADGSVRRVVVRPSVASGPSCRADGRVDVTGPDEAIAADVVVSALPIQALRAIADEGFVRGAGLTGAMTLETVPAMSVVLAFDRRIPTSFQGALLASGSRIRNIVDLDALHGQPSTSTRLQMLVGRAAECTSMSDEEIVDVLLRDLRRLVPAVVGARLVDRHVSRIEAAMFAATPGAHARRPSCQTGIENFFLAGDWTTHHLNASMEGAAWSGRTAARAVAAQFASSTAAAVS